MIWETNSYSESVICQLLDLIRYKEQTWYQYYLMFLLKKKKVASGIMSSFRPCVFAES